MMSPRRWILLLIFYISYLMFGASIYYHIEHNLEKEGRATQLQERIEINEYLVDQLANKNESDRNSVLEKITGYCGKPVTNYTTDLYEDPYKWTFYHAFFFSFTVLSTVGYGNLAPTTTLGRMIMIAYSLLGIPVNCILFSCLGEYFSKTFTSIYRRYKKYKLSNDIRYVPPQLGLFATVCIALVPGITFFIILPSLIFSYFEKWSFATSVYYSYVTMTTIGFGDFVPTFQPQQPREFGPLFVVYQIFIIVWFIFSLGYLVMIMTFIGKGLQSKRLSRLEYQLTENIKATQNRIWNGVNKDVGFLRRILNELYIMKFKPVYNEPLYFTEKRSISCPDLTMYRVDPPVIGRKRAFSECYGDARAGGTPPFRTSSDTELTNINKQKTFESAENFKQTTDLLAQVVTALASIKPTDEQLTIASSGMHGGYHGFTDSQILASEWSFPPAGMDGIPQRNRAFSDFNLNPKTSIRPGANEWTWSGDNNQIQQAINIRCRNRQARDDYYRSSFPTPLEGVVVDIDRDEAGTSRQRRKFSMPDASKQFFKKLIPFKKRSSQGLIDKNDFTNRKFSISSVPEVPDAFNPAHDHYKTINVGHPDVKKSISGSSSIQNIFANGGTNGPSMANRRGTIYDVDPQQESYQRNGPPAAGGLRKRRESLFTQNPNMRRSSMFPGSSATHRRGSLFTDPAARHAPRAGSGNRRPSLISVMDMETQPNQEILENTTIADLIRALEVMHTQAVLQLPVDESSADKKKRKLGTAGLGAPTIPPIFSIFNQDEQPSTSSNRLYSRRSTIVGPASNQSTTSNILTRRRQSALPAEFNEPPPSYSEKEEPKFKRRFSVRPTNLQIPPGMAPPPSQVAATSGQNAAQTALQRRLSLRPSPLAAIEGTPTSTNRTGPSGASRTTTQPSSSSTHSPLSRIVQISQAQRKNSEQKEPK